MNRLALGTAQFGLDYGVANQTGRVPPDEVRSILNEARNAGMDLLDTAVAYGVSEAALGRAGVRGWQVVTKLPACPASLLDVADWVRAQVDGSLRRLGLTRLYGLLLHRPKQLLEPMGPTLLRSLRQLQQDGWVEKIGLSVYEPEELDSLMGCFTPELVQLPYNALDGRWGQRWLPSLAAMGVEIHARSVFLQGLLLMPAARRPAYFARWGDTWAAWATWLASSGQEPLQACLGAVLARPEIQRVVVGVDSAAQLRQLLAAADVGALEVPAGLQIRDPELLNPALWKLR